MVVGKQQEGRSGGDLEESDRLPCIDGFAALQGIGQSHVINELPAAQSPKPNALVKMHQMRRCIDMNTQASAFQNGAHEGDGGSLAVGACHMDGGRKPSMGIAKAHEKSLDTPQREVNGLWMQAFEPLKENLRLSHDGLCRKPFDRRSKKMRLRKGLIEKVV